MTSKKVERGQWIEDRGKKEMLNHKFQIRIKSQISNNKPQTNPNIQIQMFKTGSLGFGSLEFGTCLIFGACNLEFICNLV
ncbi:MAG: hypothetical protein J7L42_06330, partial [Elusimicrobia bacterium]|nr:hypothetical protein [Elusimicrobiota bacterium]